MPERISALHGSYPLGKFGAAVETAVCLHEVVGLNLQQITAWHDTHAQVAESAATAAGQSGGTLLPIAPLTWWLLGGHHPGLAAELGATLDLSHSRTQLQISGARATDLLNRHIPIDLRAASFPEGAVASSALHHVNITMWHSPQGYELFITRSSALFVWDLLVESAAQFGGEII